MRVRWEVDDGYAGKSRPHFVDIDEEEFEGCETQKEKDAIIEEYVKQAFDENICYYWEVQ